MRANLPLLATVTVALLATAVNVLADEPDRLDPGADQALAMVVSARGAQLYECRAGRDGGRPAEWAFLGPKADLYDAQGRRIGDHGAGPYWEAADGSRVVGTVKARADAPVQGAVPWLLLSTRSAAGEGMFSAVTSIQRVRTTGGVPPVSPCSSELDGSIVSVPYTADYRLFRRLQDKPCAACSSQ